MALAPESKSALASLERASLVGSAANTLATGLPDLVDRERQALFANLTNTLNTQSATIGDLSSNLRGTLEAGTSTANALNTLLGSATKLSAMFVSPNPTPPPPSQQSGPPFDIRDYTEAIRALGTTSQQLIPLAQQLDSAVPVIEVTAQGIIDKAIRELLVLVAVAILGTLGAALAYRAIVIRMQRHAA